jgi:ribonuclease Z
MQAQVLLRRTLPQCRSLATAGARTTTHGFANSRGPRGEGGYSEPSRRHGENRHQERLQGRYSKRFHPGRGKPWKRATAKHDFTGLELTFLGTAAGAPNAERSPSCIVLRCPLRAYIFDAGEGSLRQLQQSHIRTVLVEDIFISHMHGDHIFGLPSLIMGINYAFVDAPSKEQTTRPWPPVLTIYGPVGLAAFIHASLSASKSVLGIKVVVVELETPRSQASSSSREAPTRLWRNMRLERLRPQDDGTFEVYSRLGNHTCPSIRIRARTIDHACVDCFGWVIDERKEVWRVNAAKATALGLPPSPPYQLLQQGLPVTLENGTVISPNDVCFPPKNGRKIVIMGDTNNGSNMVDIAAGADVLVHESTAGSDMPEDVIRDRGHSTARMAGEFARSIGAHWLLLTHVSARYGNISPEMMINAPLRDFQGQIKAMRLAREASSSFKSSNVQLAQDFMTFSLPVDGFTDHGRSLTKLGQMVSFHGAGGLKVLRDWKISTEEDR